MCLGREEKRRERTLYYTTLDLYTSTIPFSLGNGSDRDIYGLQREVFYE